TLGLGASLAVFTVADNLLMRPLPYRNASQLVMVWEAERTNGNNRNVVSPANYLDWKAQNDVLDGAAAFTPVRTVLTDQRRAEEFREESVTPIFSPYSVSIRCVGDCLPGKKIEIRVGWC